MKSQHKTLNEKELKEAKRFDQNVTRLYKKNSDLIVEPIHWEKFNTNHQMHHPYAYIVHSLGFLNGKKVLEVGCGTGIFSVILVKRGAQFVEAFDISRRSIELARKRAQINNVAERVNFRTMSIYDMDYQQNSFDYIVGLNILHHIDIEKVVGRFHKFLKPGGLAYFSDPFGNVQWLEKLRLLMPVEVKEDDKSHWQEQLKYKDVNKFRACFKNVECLEFHLLSRLDRMIKSRRVLSALSTIDKWLLTYISYLRKYARRIVIKLEK